MNRLFYLLLLVLAGFHLSAQEDMKGRMPLLNEDAPHFIAESTQGTINFPSDYFAKWKILLSHPADFTAVCSSELLELAEMQDEFTRLRAALVVVSTDSKNSHIAWVKSLEEVGKVSNPAFQIQFPLVADEGYHISRLYGMLHPKASTTEDVRAVFIISPDDKIAAVFYYPLTVGRNLEEIKRTLIALQTHEKHQVILPANWLPGEDVMLPSPSSMKEAEKLENKKDKSLYSPVWYMWYKKLAL